MKQEIPHKLSMCDRELGDWFSNMNLRGTPNLALRCFEDHRLDDGFAGCAIWV